MSVCPNKNTSEWKSMVESVGEDLANDIFVTNDNTIPTLSEKNQLYNDILQILERPEEAKRVWYLTKTSQFKALNNSYLNKNDEGDYVLTIADIQKFVAFDEIVNPMVFSEIPALGSDKTIAYVKEINSRFFNALFSGVFDQENDSAVLNLDTKVEDIYDSLYKGYTKQLEHPNPIAQRVAKEILDNWKGLKRNHILYLDQYRVKSKFYLEEDRMQKDTYSHTPAQEIDMKSLVDDPIRLLVASLPDIEVNPKTGKLRPTLSRYNSISTTNFNRTMNLLNNELANLPSFEAMINRLDYLTTKYPFLAVLLKRLGARKNIEELTDSQRILQSQFYKAFAHSRYNPLIGILMNNGNIVMNAMTSDTLENVIKARWLNEAKRPSATLVKKDEKGRYMLDYDRITKTTVAQIQQLNAKERLEFLKRLGIVIESKFDQEVDGSNPAIVKFLEWFRRNIKPDTTINDIFNREVIEINKEVKNLVEYAKAFEINDKDLMYYNQEGKPEYMISLDSYITETVNRLNYYADISGEAALPEEIAHLYPEKLGGDNYYTNNSKILSELFNPETVSEDSKIQGVILKAFKPENKSGTHISELKEIDYKILLFENIARGTVPLMRSADRKTEHGFQHHAFLVEPPLRSVFVEDMISYLEDELAVSFAYYRDKVGSSYKFASEHLQKLRTFDFLWTNSEQKQLLKGYSDNNPDINSPVELAQSFIEEHRKELENKIDNYIEDYVDRILNMLLEDEIITETNNGYSTKLLSPELITNLTSTKASPKGSNLVLRGEMRKVAELVAYNYFVGTQEQLKIMLGDLSNYKDAVDFHKRVNGATSTRYRARNDVEKVRELNFKYTKFNSQPHTKTAKQVVFQDPVGSNPELVEAFGISEYEGFDKADAQAHMTLDEYRAFLDRAGLWGDKEMTYQYEMQYLALKILSREDLQNIYPFTEEDFIKLFGEHTDGIVPDAPMYKGEPINLAKNKLPKLGPLKPQGFGNNTEISAYTSADFTKISIAPLLPSTVTEEGLKRLLSMHKYDVGFITFGTGKKTDVLVNDNNELNTFGEINDNTLITELNYDNFGIQVDVHADFKDKVTASTQRTRLEFVDVFNRGELEKTEDLKQLKEEYDSIIGELVNRDAENLKKELTITRSEDGYKVKDIKAFRNKLIDLMKTRQLPFNTIDGIDLSLASDHQYLDLLANRTEVESILLATARNRVLSRKIKGELLIQESDVFYDDKLKFYEKKDGSVSEMEVRIPLPDQLVSYVEKHGGLSNFNSKIAKGQIDERILKIPANRIPSHFTSTLEALKVVEFLPNHVGPKIVVPGGIVVKAGADFDVDKLTTYYKSFKIRKGELVYAEFQNEINESSLKKIYDYKYKGLINTYNYYLEQSKEEALKASDMREQLQAQAPELVAQADKADKVNDILAKLAEAISNIPSLDEFIEENQDKSPLEVNDKDALDNRLLEISNEATLHPERFEDLIKPTGAESLKALAEKYGTKESEDLYTSKNSNGKWHYVTELPYNIKKATSFFSAKSLISLAATHTVSHASTQYAPIKLNPDPAFRIYFRGQEIKNESVTEVNVSSAEKVRKYTPENITELKPNQVFVFGANTAGGHGGGTAGLAQRGKATSNYTALPLGTKGKWSEYGVVDKLMEGTEGKSFGIVTKAATIKGKSLKIGPKRSVPLSRIEESINKLIQTAKENPDLEFLVTKFGTNMAGFSVEEIRSLLQNKDIPDNIILPREFEIREIQTKIVRNQTGQYMMGHKYDSDGNSIATVFGEILQAAVDAAKDDFISSINISPQTLGAVAFLMRTGKNSGVSIKYIVKLLTHPVVLDYLKIRARQETIAKQGKTKYQSKEETVDSYLSDITNKEFNQKNTTYFDLSEYFLASGEEKATLSDRIAALQEANGYKYLTLKDLEDKNPSNKMKLQILDNFLSYIEYGKVLANFQRVTRPDAGMASSFNYLDRLAKSEDNLFRAGLYDSNDISNFKHKSFLKNMFDFQSQIQPMFGQFFIHRSLAAIEALEPIFDIYRSPALGLGEQKLNKIERKLTDQLVSAVFIRALFGSSNKQEQYKELMFGENSVPKRILEMQKAYKDNPLIQEFMPIIRDYNRKSAKERPYDNIKLFNRKFTTDEVNELVSAFMNLFNEPTTKNLAIDLLKFSLIQSGVTNSPISFNQIIPNKLLLAASNRFISNLKDNIATPEVKKFFEIAVEEAMRNNLKDQNLIPVNNKKIYAIGSQLNRRSLDSKQRMSKYPYFAQKVLRIKSENEMRAFTARGLRIPYELVLYKRIPPKLGQLSIDFQKVDARGDGFNFLEMYFDMKVPSILEENRTNFKPTAVSIADVVKDQADPNIETDEALDDINAEISEARKKKGGRRMYSGSEEIAKVPESSNAELNKIVKDFLSDIGVSFETVEAFYDRNGQKINAKAVADFVAGTVEAVNENTLSKTDIPEEAAHWYVELLGEENPLYQKMMKDIVNYEVYNEVKNSTFYQDQYKGDETLYRKEAIGKLIAQNMVREYEEVEDSKVFRWIKAIISKLKKLFGIGSNPFISTAQNILKNNISELSLTSTEVSKNAVAQSNIVSQLRAMSDNIVMELTDSRDFKEFRDNNQYKEEEYALIHDDQIVGTFPVQLGRFGKQNMAHFNLPMIKQEYRGMGLGKKAYAKLSADLIERGYIVQSDVDGAVSKYARNVWNSLLKAGLAVEGKIYNKPDTRMGNKLVKVPYMMAVNESKLYSEAPRPVVANDNSKEMSKEIEEFDKMFPEYSDLTESEKNFLMDQFKNGNLNIVCGL